jgi:uncharacterized protein (TIGR02118 family)
MIKMIFCLKRLPQLSRGEFQRYWREQHAPLVKRHAAALKVRRYVQSHTISDPRLEMVSVARGSGGLDFDGVAELWWDSLESLLAAVSTEAGQVAGRELLEDEARFIDLPNSPVFFTEEFEVVG